MRAQSRMVAAGCLVASSVALPATALAAACAGFSDVDVSDATYCSAVTFIKNKGVTLGCGDGSTYCPNDYVTRLQMALFMQRLARGGPGNVLPDATSTIGGGESNSIQGTGRYGTIGGGASNAAAGEFASLGGGLLNASNGDYATVAGGVGNDATGIAATIPGGSNNSATGNYSFAAGVLASDAGHHGSFVWADSIGHAFSASADNTFIARATGGVGFAVAVNASGNPTQNCLLLPGTPSWQCTSDRNAKENLVEADGAAVLARLADMPVYTYSMKGSDPAQRSMGPTAQDFHAAFGLGINDTTIASINLDGVALAAIKGLNQRLEAIEQRLEAERAANAELRAQLAATRREPPR